MAFLCPVRRRRDKKKATNANIELHPAVIGRITGSSSVETLVRVGIEKEHGLSADSKMFVLHDFIPCVDDELEVKRGQIVNILYRENDWVYVIGQDSRQEGFIPYSYCAPYNTQLAELAIKKKLPRDQQHVGGGEMSENLPLLSASDGKYEYNDEKVHSGGTSLKNSETSLTSDAEMPFLKEASGRYIVLYTFIARDENDLNVERGEFVTVLNREDTDWFWVVRSDGQEGFIPSAFVYPADTVLQTHQKMLNASSKLAALDNSTVGGGGGHANAAANLNQSQLPNSDLVPNAIIGNVNVQPLSLLGQLDANTTAMGSLQQQQQQQQQQQLQTHQQQMGLSGDDFHGTELVMLYDYKAQAPDDLSVRRGDWIYADLNNQTVDGWLWAYAPKTRKYGFIPKAYARPPAMTSL